jgi:hypothetical protein
MIIRADLESLFRPGFSRLHGYGFSKLSADQQPNSRPATAGIYEVLKVGAGLHCRTVARRRDDVTTYQKAKANISMLGRDLASFDV